MQLDSCASSLTENERLDPEFINLGDVGCAMAGKTLGGRYSIIKQLKEGGFGNVFLAEDQHRPGNPPCLVKQLKPEVIGPAVIRMFEQEADVLGRLGSHDQIPSLLAHFEQDNCFYLVQEFIDGHELKREMLSGKPLSESFVINFLQEMLDILAFVHQQGVIHRDIKPSNILRRRQDWKLVLIDFGAVKQIGHPIAASHHTYSVIVGSAGYMPNEQLAGKPRYCSDIYALGMIAIQALTGTYPRELPEDVMTSEICWRDRAQVSPQLADILDRMVRYDFRDRYPTVNDVLQDFQAAQFEVTQPVVMVLPEGEADVPEQSSMQTLPILVQHATDEVLFPDLPPLEATPPVPAPTVRPADEITEWVEKHGVQSVVQAAIHAVDQAFNIASHHRTESSISDDAASRSQVLLSCDRLETLLAAEQWRDADEETLTLLLQGCHRQFDRWMSVADIHGLPCQTLHQIDRLWAKYSHGQFGLSLQTQIWQEVGQVYEDLCDRVSWRENGTWKRYSHLTFDLSAPLGHLPGIFRWRVLDIGDADDDASSMGVPYGWGGILAISAIAERLAQCRECPAPADSCNSRLAD